MPPDQPAGPIATPRAATGVLYFDGPDHVLLVHPTYKDGWDLPGGYLMPGETPTSALRRELREELGTELPIGELLVVDWAPNEREGDKILFVFDGGELTAAQLAAIRVDGVEIDRFAYHPRADLDTLLIPRLARRVHAAIEAKANTATVYLEHGRQSAYVGIDADVERQIERDLLEEALLAAEAAAGSIPPMIKDEAAALFSELKSAPELQGE